MTTEEIESLTESQLKTFHEMSEELLYKSLVERSISENTLDIVISPLGDMTLEKKQSYAKKLTTILKTSKTEMEVLQRSKDLIQKPKDTQN